MATLARRKQAKARRSFIHIVSFALAFVSAFSGLAIWADPPPRPDEIPVPPIPTVNQPPPVPTSAGELARFLTLHDDIETQKKALGEATIKAKEIENRNSELMDTYERNCSSHRRWLWFLVIVAAGFFVGSMVLWPRDVESDEVLADSDSFTATYQSSISSNGTKETRESIKAAPRHLSVSNHTIKQAGNNTKKTVLGLVAKRTIVDGKAVSHSEFTLENTLQVVTNKDGIEREEAAALIPSRVKVRLRELAHQDRSKQRTELFQLLCQHFTGLYQKEGEQVKLLAPLGDAIADVYETFMQPTDQSHELLCRIEKIVDSWKHKAKSTLASRLSLLIDNDFSK